MANLSDYIIGGIQGIQGITGSQGIQGLQGIQGVQGLQGIQGILGYSIVSINTQTTAYTLQLTDADGVIIRMNSATNIDLTIPLNSSVAIPIGTRILIEQMGAGVITVVATSGVIINSSAKKTWGQYSVIEIMKLGTDLWNVIGGSV
jgi:3D (Asp-Asp-Asp) domain-containing protein